MLVTLEELKTHLRLEGDGEDDYLKSLLAAAKAVVEDHCKTTFDDKPPEPVRLAALLFASHLYSYRESSDPDAYTTMMQAFRALLSPHRDAEQLF